MRRREFLKSAAALAPLAPLGLALRAAEAKPSSQALYAYAGGDTPLRKSSRPLLKSTIYETPNGLVLVRIWEPGWSSSRAANGDILLACGGEMWSELGCNFRVSSGGLVPLAGHVGPIPAFLRRHYAPGQDPAFESPSIDIFEVALVHALSPAGGP